ncbi:MAG: hypothetical protein ACC631_07880, partial [Halocynthiibacter sp.]
PREDFSARFQRTKTLIMGIRAIDAGLHKKRVTNRLAVKHPDPAEVPVARSSAVVRMAGWRVPILRKYRYGGVKPHRHIHTNMSAFLGAFGHCTLAKKY